MSDPATACDRRRFLAGLGALGLGALWGCAGPRAFSPLGGGGGGGGDRRPPNVVVILMDDMGLGDVGCYGSHLLATPVMDRLAAEGVRCTRMYSAPTCSPARAQILTGCYAQRVGVPRVIFADDEWGLEADFPTIATHLKAAGYATAAYGKWHVGVKERHLPTRLGFDTYFGPFAEPSQPVVSCWRDETPDVAQIPCSAVTRTFTDEALGFIDAHQQQPFFVYLAHPMPHVPIGAEPPHLGRSRAGLYGDVIETIDQEIGRILDRLRQHGLLDDTMVIVTSDNGPWYQGRTGGLTGRKFETYEGGVRVPFIARGPGLPSGRVCNEPLHLMDVLPTALRAAGRPIPTGLDGRDMTATLAGTSSSPHDCLHLWHVYTQGAVIEGRWKLNLIQQRGEYPRKGEFPHLIDLVEDPEEAYSVADRHPEVVARLSARAEAFAAEMKPFYRKERDKR